jgi:hypothetical protein
MERDGCLRLALACAKYWHDTRQGLTLEEGEWWKVMF